MRSPDEPKLSIQSYTKMFVLTCFAPRRVGDQPSGSIPQRAGATPSLRPAGRLWNDVGLDVLDGTLYLGFHFTGGLLEPRGLVRIQNCWRD